MQRKISFIVALLLMVFSGSVKSQIQTIKFSLTSNTNIFSKKISALNWQNNFELINTLPYSKNLLSDFSIELRKENFNTQTLPFFCQKEWQFEKSTHIPLKFRLGSFDYTNMLEGKNNSYITQKQ
jgi:hypothetical protein